MFEVVWLLRKLGPVIGALVVQMVRALVKVPRADREYVARDLLRVAEMQAKILGFDRAMNGERP